MFNQHDLSRNEWMLTGSFRHRGYDWWWHSFTAVNQRTGEARPFFIEFFSVILLLAGMRLCLANFPRISKTVFVPPILW